MTADSVKRAGPGKGAPAERRAQTEPAAAPGGGFRPAHLFVILTMIAAGGGVAAAGSATPAHAVFVSLAVGSVGLAAFALYRTVWPLVAPPSGGEFDQADRRLHIALEGERAMVRRAVGDLEFDRAMGKISEADFQEMRARVEAGPPAYRDSIERDLAARAIADAGPPVTAVSAAGAGSDPDGRPLPRSCGSCGTSNDPDAEFCKKCGSRLSR